MHGVCAVMTEDFLRRQVSIGNDLVTPRPQWSFPGLRPGDRWCVVAVRWLQAHRDGAAAPVVLASTHETSRSSRWRCCRPMPWTCPTTSRT